MNIFVNRLSTTMTDAELTDVKKAIDGIAGKMPFLTGLTVDERIALPKINEGNKVFVGDSINALINNAAIVPSYLNIAEIQKDLTLYEQLDQLELVISQLLEKIQDTRILAGSEAYASSLTAYRLFEAAANAGIPGSDAVYSTLKQRFAGQGGTGKTPDTPPQN